MPATFYSDGTISVANGSLTVTGVGTAWATGLVAGGLLIAGGVAAIINSVVSDTEITLKRAWPGATLSGAVYDIQLESADAATAIWSNQTLAEIIAQIEAGTFLDFDATGTLAQRAAFNGAAQGFVYCQSDVNPFLVFIKKSATSGDWSAGTSLKGSDGTNGTNGANGYSGPRYCYSSTTTDADPGAGKFRLNNATIASATALYIDDVDAGSVSMTTWLDSMDNSSSVSKGQIIFRNIATQSVFAVFDVTGSVVVGSGYRKLTVAYLAGSGAFTNDDFFGVQFARTGDKGAWSGAEADVFPTLDDRVPVKTVGGLYCLSPIRDAVPYSMINILPDGGRFGGVPEPFQLTPTYVAPTYFGGYNGSTLAAGPKFVYNNSNNGGPNTMDSTMNDLIQAMRPGAVGTTYWRYGTEFYSLDITAGAGVVSAVTIASVVHAPCISNALFHCGKNYSLYFWARAISGSFGLATSYPYREVYADGVEILSNTAFDSASGWHRVSCHYKYGVTNDLNYASGLSFPLLAAAGSVIRIAAPAIILGSAYPTQILGTVPSARALG